MTGVGGIAFRGDGKPGASSLNRLGSWLRTAGHVAIAPISFSRKSL